ncbi:mitochondrial ribosomal protein L29 [Raphidocelis subcapitata]|uniref:Mitochondrial ribosomal protein L29 n=1 Tax=Raphidocelis subcapitata TaxID=307507 RepID=A0A2V0PN29_9CHLO|nr:mitochondrial ribosomal protein L29 [Raphidocelis subcapitata]|eukprot:GBF98505.1 mitochondrial ribosomal protein L29 [Raphidocelis subcapitata]
MQALTQTRTRAFAPAAGSSSARRGVAVVTRVKPSRAGDYRALSEAELMQGVASLKAEYTKLQYMKRTRGKMTNPETLQDPTDDGVAPKGHEFKNVRRQLAQMLTVLREKQVADGLDRKASRALQKEASIAAGFGGR